MINLSTFYLAHTKYGKNWLVILVSAFPLVVYFFFKDQCDIVNT